MRLFVKRPEGRKTGNRKLERGKRQGEGPEDQRPEVRCRRGKAFGRWRSEDRELRSLEVYPPSAAPEATRVGGRTMDDEEPEVRNQRSEVWKMRKN